MTFALVTAVLIGGLMLALVTPALSVHPSAIAIAKRYFEGLQAVLRRHVDSYVPFRGSQQVCEAASSTNTDMRRRSAVPGIRLNLN